MQMYAVASDRVVNRKHERFVVGQQITAGDLLEGTNVDALIEGGHLTVVEMPAADTDSGDDGVEEADMESTQTEAKPADKPKPAGGKSGSANRGGQETRPAAGSGQETR